MAVWTSIGHFDTAAERCMAIVEGVKIRIIWGATFNGNRSSSLTKLGLASNVDRQENGSKLVQVARISGRPCKVYKQPPCLADTILERLLAGSASIDPHTTISITKCDAAITR